MTKKSKEEIWNEKIKEIDLEVKKRKMINKIPNNLKYKERKRLIEDEFLIIDEDENLIISGGGRICLFLLLEYGYVNELKRLYKNNNLKSYYDLMYFFKKLKRFKLHYGDFNKDKVIQNNLNKEFMKGGKKMKVKELIKQLSQTGQENEVRIINTNCPLSSSEENTENLYLSFDDKGDVLIYQVD
jgi:hypothetical protein